MLIYLVLFAVITILYVPLSSDQKRIKLYCFLICIALSLVAGLRHESLGLNDTEHVYQITFYRILDNDLSYTLSLKDKGFQLLTFIFTRVFGDNFKFYVLLFTVPYMAAVSFIIYKYSDDKRLSFVIFMCLHYFEISFTLMRQINGMAILCLALHFFIQKKYGKYAVLVLLASCFHAVCLVFFVIGLFIFVKPKKWMLVPMLAAMGIALMFPRQIIGAAYLLYDSERFLRLEAANRTKNLTFFFINLTIWLAEVLSYSRIKKRREYMVFFICSSICLALSPLTVVLGEVSRIAYLFGLFNVVLLPESVKLFKIGRSRFYIRMVCSVLLLLYLVLFLGPQVNIIPYYI